MIQQQDLSHRHLVYLVCLFCFHLLKHLQQSMQKSRFVQRQQRRGRSQYRAILSRQETRGCGHSLVTVLEDQPFKCARMKISGIWCNTALWPSLPKAYVISKRHSVKVTMILWVPQSYMDHRIISFRLTFFKKTEQINSQA